MSAPTGPSSHASSHTIALLPLLAAALNLYLWNNDFPLGYHYDEPKKVDFIREGWQDFHHPILMLQIVRAVNGVLRLEDPFDVVVLGRTTTALAAVLLVLATYWLARQVTGPRTSLLVAAGVAFSPITVMHAHYLKEDVLFAAWGMASLAAYLRFLREASPERAVVLGIATGLAGASQYKAGLLVPLYIVFPLCVSGLCRRRVYPLGALAAFVAVDVFVLVNLPLVGDVQGFWRGVEHDARQIAAPPLPIRAIDHWCTFYWWRGLVPGLTLPLATAGLAGLVGLVGTLARCRRVSWEWQLLAGYVLTYYFVQEFSPSKPPPNYERYMVPVAPVVVCFAGRLVEQVAGVCRSGVRRAAVAGAALAAIAYPAIVSLRITHDLADDTRQRAEQWFDEHSGLAIWERFTGPGWSIESAGDLEIGELRDRGVHYVVTSSFTYSIHEALAALADQPEIVYERARGYRELFDRPYIEIRPGFRSFGFNNPVIRIVDVASEPAARPFARLRGGPGSPAVTSAPDRR